MKLNINSIINERGLWESKGFKLPDFDLCKVKAQTEAAPEWVHFGGGNIFRGYIACLADELIGMGEMKSGIIATDSFDTEVIEKIYRPFDDLALLVGLRAGGGRYLRIIGGIGGALAAEGVDFDKLKTIACASSLKMISFTITEKGYAYTDLNGDILASAASDAEHGPNGEMTTALGKVTAMLCQRFRSGAAPIALVSMDNCSRNGEKLRSGVLFMAQSWQKNGLAPEGFYEYVSDESRVSFPWSMIDKITPRPDPEIAKELGALGIEDMQPIVTARKTFIAPFVNAEMPQYLVIEDSFPNGRPPLEKAGVYLTDRETVGKAEKMKVMTCLNPLHTALAVFGCLLGFTKIADEMNDPDLSRLVNMLGYKEGLPVVIDPVIISPESFLNEVLTERLPNACLPDTPQRIATDTSQKVAIRFGETVKAYEKLGTASSLTLIPLVIAAWLRYLIARDDNGEAMELSADPMLPELTAKLDPEWFGGVKAFDEAAKAEVAEILSNSELFGTDLVKAGLGDKVTEFLEKMLAGRGAVRSTLKAALE